MSKKKATKKTKKKKVQFELFWRAKWTTDGATSLPAAAKMLRRAAKYLDKLASAGVVFKVPVDDDYGHMVTDDPKVAEYFGFSKIEDE